MAVWIWTQSPSSLNDFSQEQVRRCRLSHQDRRSDHPYRAGCFRSRSICRFDAVRRRHRGNDRVSAAKSPLAISETVHRHENRLRTTLTHEYGHVILHAYLFAMAERQLKLGSNQKPNAIYCYRDNMLPAGKTDWMEWQAGYASGAALMPKSHVTRLVAGFQERFGIYGPVSADNKNGRALISAMINSLPVSREAATVRLKALHFIGAEQAAGSLLADLRPS